MKNESVKKVHTEGVFAAQKKDGTVYYRSSLTHRSKHISLGSFPTEEAAGKAYREGKWILENASIPLSGYTKGSPLSFEKWVCLINFRDNGIYFANPIYIRPRMLFYHLSPDQTLKFDLDDLFYYSSHKIMQRGGHLFVSDYGSQITIGSRYGIKAYAVPGRDYRFINGDPLDYRRENLEISNIYHGVLPGPDGEGYLARIHVRGYLHIGIYESGLEAAIAYNKAADILRKKGCKKEYALNYIEEISPKVYAEIYSQCRISDSVNNWSAEN